ncbi:DUF4139 domain-containing protein [Novosphingobium album (ex Liu et al. 2023)]|uniref:DUF4139 domain-containing protein n=1 Tax=Novosphingobium album (ex Liu et al. 2023) TaxID=3031130 RepID=A0ABT5WSH2_9SPHN|nr:DUF4139 domain-containing protein [Novosphingobium album (ex Liu et al. 2023)]MDE8652982.1 DUF4139 domain-containing protein [Novosphingobium album (ex Liu et al. 2023)]
MRLAIFLMGSACAIVPVPAFAQAGQGDVSVTIYNNDQALIQDARRIDLPAGISRQEFPGVSASLRPETVTLSASGTGVVEQNFDYDLLTPAKLMEKAVGQTVTVVRTNLATGVETSEQALVLANNAGTVLRIGNRIEILQNYGARVVFPRLPENLRANPTLSVTLDTQAAGPRPVTLNYLSRGLGWKADYVALFDETAGKLDMQGWITLINNSGTTFGNARVLLVAGSPGQAGPDARYRPSPQPVRAPSGNRPGSESADRERLGDYYVYPLAGRTTVANAQQKQASFLDVEGAPASKGYFYRNGWMGQSDEPVSADTVLRFSSSREGGLGDALPAGTVRVYMRDARGQSQFIGEDTIGHTPMGSLLALKTGEAFDVKVKPTLENREKITTDEWERTARYRITRDGKTEDVTVDRTRTYWRTTMSYTLTNARPEPVTVEIVQAGLDNGWQDTRIPSESVKGEQRSRDERAWLVPVPAQGEARLTVQFDTRY